MSIESWVHMTLRFLLAAAVLIVATTRPGIAAADLSTTVKFDIAPQPLSAALLKYSEQSGVQVASSSALLDGKQSAGVVGSFPAAAALERVLDGTGLKYAAMDPNSVVIRVPAAAANSTDASAPSASQSEKEAPKSFWQRFRLAQTDTSPRSEESLPSSDQRPDSKKPVPLDEVIVTGTNIHGGTNDTLPVTVLDKRYIDSTGMSTTVQLIESLPQNFALANQSGVFTPGVTSAGNQGVAINLRGIGEGTTLVLLNGRRLAPGFLGSAVDISALPLSAVERVEVLTDAASAIYGSDAVGGVVNFILKSDFDGAESGIRAGSAPGGVEEYRASQTLGSDWRSGNALVALEYYGRDLLPASERNFVSNESLIGSLLPEEKDYSATFAGRQTLSENVSVFSDALYARRDSSSVGRTIYGERHDASNPQISAVAGLEWRLGGDWRAEAAGTYGKNDLDSRYSAIFYAADGGAQVHHSISDVESIDLKADGPLFSMPGGQVKLASGVSWRAEAYRQQVHLLSGTLVNAEDLDRHVSSGFAEVLVPIVGATNARPWVRRLDLSLAGRFDDYSDFGSSLDPRIGVMWEPVAGLKLRGSYGTSFRAPRLIDFTLAGNITIAQTGADAETPGGVSHQIVAYGNDPSNLRPQESTSYTVGVEFRPPSVQRLTLSASYYSIRYRQQIVDPPDPAVILGDSASFGSLAIRNPSLDQINKFISFGQLGQGFFAYDPAFNLDPAFDPSTIGVIIDKRRRNLSATETSGVDLSIGYDFGVDDSHFDLGLAGTYIFSLDQQVTAGSSVFDTVNTFGNPTHLRLRGSLGWRREPFSANAFVNYTDSYEDNRAAAPVAISSYTTVDLRLACSFGSRAAEGRRFLLALSAQNVLNRDPPRTQAFNPALNDQGFDPANASPLGRLLALEFSVVW